VWNPAAQADWVQSLNSKLSKINRVTFVCVRQWQVHPAACFGQIPATGLIAVSGALQYRGTKFCSWLLHIHGVTVGAHNHQFNMS